MKCKMQIMINISEDDYRKVQDGRASVSMMLKAIGNGTPRPKGHGTLIDSDKLIDKWAKTTVRGRTEFDQVIMCEPTVIPAESEG